MKRLSERLNKLISDRGMSTKEFAETYGLPVATIYDISQNKRSPSPKIFFDIINKAKVKPDYLLCPYVEKDKFLLVWELLDMIDNMPFAEYQESVKTIEFFIQLFSSYQRGTQND